MKTHPLVIGLTALKLVLVVLAVVLQGSGHLSPQIAAILATAVAAFGLTSAVHAASSPREPSAAVGQLLAAVAGAAQQFVSSGLGQPASGAVAPPSSTNAAQRGFGSLRALAFVALLGVAGLAFGFVGTACTAAERSAIQKDVSSLRASVQSASLTVRDFVCLVNSHVPSLPLPGTVGAIVTDSHEGIMALCDIADGDVPAAAAILDNLDKLAVSTSPSPPPARPAAPAPDGGP